MGAQVKRIGGSLPTAPTLGLAPPGYEIPPLRGWQKPLQDPTPVERARTVTRMAGVLNHAHFEPFSGRFAPIRPTNPRCERKGYALLGTRSTRVLHRPPGHCSPASRIPHPAPRRRPSAPAGSSYEPTLPRWLLPDADTRIGKEPTESDRDDRPLSLVWHETGRSRRQKPSVELRISRALAVGVSRP